MTLSCIIYFFFSSINVYITMYKIIIKLQLFHRHKKREEIM